MPEKFQRTRIRDRAAYLVARGGTSDQKIAQVCSVTPATIQQWKHRPEFQRWIKEYLDDWHKEFLAEGLKTKEARVKLLEDRHRRLTEIILARSQDPDLQQVPGGNTGLLSRTAKAIGTGPNQRIVFEYPVDIGLLRELRAHEQQAAQEQDQWAERKEISGPGGAPIQQQLMARVQVDLRSLSDEELSVIEKVLARTLPDDESILALGSETDQS